MAVSTGCLKEKQTTFFSPSPVGENRRSVTRIALIGPVRKKKICDLRCGGPDGIVQIQVGMERETSAVVNAGFVCQKQMCASGHRIYQTGMREVGVAHLHGTRETFGSSFRTFGEEQWAAKWVGPGRSHVPGHGDLVDSIGERRAATLDQMAIRSEHFLHRWAMEQSVERRRDNCRDERLAPATGRGKSQLVVYGPGRRD